MGTWSRKSVRPGGPDDPYFEWAKATGNRYLSGAQTLGRIGVILELAGKTAQQLARGEWDPPERWKRWMHVPALYADPASGLENASYCTASVTSEFFVQLRARSALRRVVQRVGLGAPMELLPGGKPSARPSLQRKAKPGLAVVGMVDDGLAFAHERFRRKGKTRIEYFWRQDGPPIPMPGPGYGAELRKGNPKGIDRAIGRSTHAGLLDEDELYRALGHIDFRRGGHQSPAARATHGAHVMDLACGFDEQGAPDTRPVIGVQLPIATTADTSGGTLAPYVLDGLRYILDRADALAVRHGSGPLPVVVNLSYGLIAGPHDGGSILEAAIDQLIELRNDRLRVPFAVVLPSGNSRQARCHASFHLAGKGAEQRLDWRVPPDDATPSYMEIWLPRAAAPGAAPKLAIQITPPGGVAGPWIKEGEAYAWQEGARVLCEAVYLQKAALGCGGNMILLALAETSTQEPQRAVAPAGSWRVLVRNAAAAAVTVDAWIQRDDTPYGYPQRGRQSRFEDPAYKYVDDAGRLVEEDCPGSYVKRDGTINALATGGKPIVIGGYRRTDGEPASYSAGGPAALAGGGAARRTGPDAMAPSEDSVARRGLLAAGARSGSKIAMNGTSVAAPQIARWIASEMAAGRPGDRTAVRAEALRQELARGSPPNAPEAKIGGGGRIDIAPAIKVQR